MKCPHCGESVSSESTFCSHCGGKLIDSANPAPREKFQPSGTDDDDVERQLWNGSYSKFAMIGAWVAAAVLSVASLVVGLFGNLGGSTWLVIIAANAAIWIALVARYLYFRYSRNYVLTDQRLTHVHGLLWRQTDRIETIDIDDVAFTQGPVERMFDVGTIQVTSSDQSHPVLALPGIESVQKVAGMIDDARRRERRRRGLYIESV